MSNHRLAPKKDELVDAIARAEGMLEGLAVVHQGYKSIVENIDRLRDIRERLNAYGMGGVASPLADGRGSEQ